MVCSELARKLSDSDIYLTQEKAKDCVSIFLEEIIDALARGDRVELRRFGTFTTRQREARKGRNPRTGESVQVEAKRIPFFKAAKELNKQINTISI